MRAFVRQIPLALPPGRIAPGNVPPDYLAGVARYRELSARPNLGKPRALQYAGAHLARDTGLTWGAAMRFLKNVEVPPCMP